MKENLLALQNITLKQLNFMLIQVTLFAAPQHVQIRFHTERRQPTIVRSSKLEEDRRAAKIMTECSDETWIAPEDTTQTAALFLIDMKCPMKLQEVQLRNSVGEFGTKTFSVFGSDNSAGPWELLYNGGLEQGSDEVSTMFV